MNKTLLVTILLLVGAGSSNAQFAPARHYLGPSIGISFLGPAPQFGINYEYSMDIENFGRIGTGGIFRYLGYSDGNWNYSDVLIGAQGNYHIKVDNDLFDPWIGLTLAYDARSKSWDGPPDVPQPEPTKGGLYIGINAGGRYWVSSKVGISARMGFGTLNYGALEFGVDFKF